MPAVDLEEYLAWLRDRGVAEQHLPIYADGAGRILRHAGDVPTLTEQHVERALEAEFLGGAPDRRLKNLRSIAAGLLAHQAERAEGAWPRLAAVDLPPPTAGGGSAHASVEDLLPPESLDALLARAIATPTIDELLPAGLGAADASPNLVTLDGLGGGTAGDLPGLTPPVDALPAHLPGSLFEPADLAHPPAAPPADDGAADAALAAMPALELADVPRGLSRRARLSHMSQVAAEGGAVRGTMVDDLTAPSPEAAPAGPEPTAPAVAGTAAASTGAGPRTVPPAAGAASGRTMPPTPVPFSPGPRPGVLASRGGPLKVEKPLPGCVCRERHDVYLDDFAAEWRKIYVVVSGSLCLALAAFWGRLGGTTVALGVAALGALASGATVGWRCTDCRRWISGSALDADHRKERLTRSGLFLAAGALLTIGCIVAGHALYRQTMEERRTLRALQQLEELTGD